MSQDFTVDYDDPNDYDDVPEWYDEDEYYDQWEDEYTEWYEALDLCKAPNGHLYVAHVWAGKRAREDWGEASFHSQILRLSQLDDDWREAAVHYGRGMKANDTKHHFGDLVYAYWADNDE